MKMWLVIFTVTMIATAFGVLYLASRLYKFGVSRKFTDKRILAYTFDFMAVAALFGVLCAVLNTMNAVVCLIHFTGIWLVCDFAALFFKKPQKRYYAGWVAVVFSVAVLTAGWALDHGVWATRYTIASPKVSAPIRIIQFADSHIGTTFDGKGFAKHIRTMQAENPDVVVIVGDFVDDGTSRADMVAAAEALGEMKTKHGVFFVFGNHDKGYYDPKRRGFTGDDLIAELEKNGVTVLQDETAPIRDDIVLIGRQDAGEKYRGGVRAEMAGLVKGLDRSKYAAVLDHQPNDYKKQAESGIDLVLSGHTHGGQIFPLNDVGVWIGANDKTYGFERRENTDFIVTSGLSDWAIKFKTGTKSEYVVIDIVPDKNP